MKRCPECRRDYFDETLRFCLDDGSELVDGPRSSEDVTEVFDFSAQETLVDTQSDRDDPATKILRSGPLLDYRKLIAIVAAFVILSVFVIYFYLPRSSSEQVTTESSPPTPASVRLYWEMSEGEQLSFIAERARHVQRLIGDDTSELDPAALAAIKGQLADYVKDKDSLSQKPFEEGLRTVYGRATQFAPVVIRAYEEQKVPAALGLYQAMVESEYHDCPEIDWEHPNGGTPVGLFQFSRRTAALYGLKPADYCDVEKQSDAAARHMSDLISDFGAEKSSWTLALFSFNQGAKGVRDYLRQLRARGITERSFWAVYRNETELGRPLPEEAKRYVPRFFAAAIIGETPAAFDLSTPPLTTIRK